jgi:outer membrane protein assembly factor BamB
MRILPLALCLFLAIPAFADNWPQWRGPKNDGISPARDVPVEWGPDKNVVWKFKMPGRGSSTPCIWGDQIFLTDIDGSDVVLMCIGTDGQLRWKEKFAPLAGKRSGKGEEGNEASASCSSDGKHVWAFAGSGNLVCYTVSGKPVWEKDIRKYGKPEQFSIQFGIHWTPVLYQGRLYLQVMHRNAQKVVALDAANGNEIWQVDRPGYGKGESPDTYASAFMWDGEGGPLLIAHGNDYCTAHRLDDGKEVWRVAGLNPSNNGAWRFVASPLVTPNLIVVPSCKTGPLVGINPVGAQGTINADNKAEIWRFKSTPDVVSPLLVDGIVYVMDNGPLTAIDAKTGMQIYRKDLGKGIYRGNMVAAEGKIYVINREGVGSVVQAGKEFKVLAINDLKQKVYASPAIVDGRLYVRTWENLYCFGKK